MQIDWDLVASYALGSLIASSISAVFAVVGALVLRRWLKGSQVLAGLAQLPAMLAAREPERRDASPAEVAAVRSSLAAAGDELGALACTPAHPCGLPGCPGPGPREAAGELEAT